MRFSPGNAQGQGARSDQQDSFGFSNADQKEFVAHAGMAAIVADGMGGLASGSAASQAAVSSFLAAYETKAPVETIPEALQRAVLAAQRAVVALSGKAGTTLAATVVHNDALDWVSVGDSRIYLCRKGQLTQLSQDHNYAQDLKLEVDKGTMTMAQAAADPEREHLTSYLGHPDLPKIDRSLNSLPLEPGDYVIICSDGLYRALSEQEITEALEKDPHKTCAALLKKALLKGNPRQDNITVVALRCEPDDQVAHGPSIPIPAATITAALAALALTLGAILAYTMRPKIQDFRASPDTITAGSATNLQWSVNGGTVTIDPELGPQNPKGNRAVQPGSTAEYKLKARAFGGLLWSSRTVRVTVQPAALAAPAPPIVSRFVVTPLKVKPRASATLSWSIKNATQVTIQPDIGAVGVEGNKSIKPTTETNYVLTAKGPGGEVQGSVTVGVTGKPGGPIVNFSVDVASIKPGETATLTWTVSDDVNKVVVAPGGKVFTEPASGSIKVKPKVTTSYILTAYGKDGIIKTKTVEVAVSKPAKPKITESVAAPKIAGFDATPPVIRKGDSATLKWSITGQPAEVSIDDEVISGSNEYRVSPTDTKTYVLKISVGDTSDTKSTTVTVSPWVAPVINSFTADPQAIAAGQSTTLRWDCKGDVTEVSLEPGIGKVDPSGSVSVTPEGQSTYTLVVTGHDGATVKRDVTVTVRQ